MCPRRVLVTGLKLLLLILALAYAISGLDCSVDTFGTPGTYITYAYNVATRHAIKCSLSPDVVVGTCTGVARARVSRLRTGDQDRRSTFLNPWAALPIGAAMGAE